MNGLIMCLFLSAVACYSAEAIYARHVVVPGYPRLARMARLQGSVTVDIQISADWTVTSARGSGPNKLLERAAEENIREWTFFPPPVASSSASIQTTVTYVYKLEGKEEYYDPPPRVVLDLPYRVEVTSQPPEPQPAGTSHCQSSFD